MKRLLTTIFVLLLSQIVSASIIIDERRVYNPLLNESIESFQGFIKKLPADSTLFVEKTKEVEQAILKWMKSSEEHAYLKDFDTNLFHWQFVNSGNAKDNGYFGVMLIIPENEIRPGFYTELGAGLRNDTKYLVKHNVPWTNDGEVFSFVVRKGDYVIKEFMNWRFMYDPLNEKEKVYYSRLNINYNTKDIEGMRIEHFVGEEKRETYDGEKPTINLPKNRISTLAVYDDEILKGIICFDMKNISIDCPITFKTTFFLNGEMQKNRVLYAEPKCSDIFAVSRLEDNSFEDLVQLYSWVKNEFFPPYSTASNQ